MTEATKTRPTSKSGIVLDLHYQVAMPNPNSHLFEVMLRVRGWQASLLDLKMPVWTPGSYLVREYAKHLQEFSARDEEERSLPWCKKSKNHWQIDTLGVSEITVRYRIFANELTVRTNHLDGTHGYFNPAALFFYIPGCEQQSIRITVVPPQPEWRVTTPLAPVPGKANTFLAPDFDTLVDSPFEIGSHRSYYFEISGLEHELAIWGQGNAEPSRIIPDIEKIIQVEADIFGGLPYDRYLFLLHLSAQGYGGLEHKNCCSLNYPRLGFRSQDRYNRFIQLVAHEFFHLWNVKRIRPKALEEFDYEAENYTTSLWFCEGATSYYDILIPTRAGIYDAKTFLQSMSKDFTRLMTTPGRLFQPASESSWDAWIKLYRRDANSDNCQVSYYLKGEMICWVLDLHIREQSGNERSLDDVMRYLWQEFGIAEVGYSPEQLQQAIEYVAREDLGEFFDRYVYGTEELPIEQYLELFGLRIKTKANGNGDTAPFTGLTVKSENGKNFIKFVEVGSPAVQAGIDPDDELLAIDGLRISAEQLPERLKDYQPGDEITIALFHQDELVVRSLILAEPRPSSYRIVPAKQPTPAQEKNFRGWLKTELSDIR